MSDNSRKRKKMHGGMILIIPLIVILTLILAGVIYLFVKSNESDRLAKEASESAAAESIAASKAEAESIAEAEKLEAERLAAEKSELEIKAAQQETQPSYKEKITLTFAGDILFDPGYAIMASMISRGKGEPDITSAFDESLMNIMRSTDFFMINNEFPYSDRGAPLEGKTYTFRAKPEYADMMNVIGADLVSLANNHTNDYGLDAMLDTMDILKNAGVAYVGAGRNIDEASSPYYIEIEGMRLAILSATQIERLANPDTVGATEDSPGVFRCLDNSLLLEKIAEAENNADFVIVYIHWGTEGQVDIDYLQKEQAPQMAEAGADLIIGDHPHILEKIEYIDEVPVVYSLGNYLFNSSSQDTCLVQATLSTKEKKITDLQFIPARQSGCRTTMLEGTEADRLINYMNEISPYIDIDECGYIHKLETE